MRPDDGPGAAGANRRVLALWCPDWPTTAAAAAIGIAADAPLAIVRAGKVEACSHTARKAGVRRGMKKRQAQSLCPSLSVHDADPAREGRLFEPVVAAVTDAVPMTEVLRPGLMVIAADRAARVFAGENELAERLTAAVAAVILPRGQAGHAETGGHTGLVARAGIADELFTAVLAARSGQSVPPGADADYLAPRPITDLILEASLSGPDRDASVNLLWRLGIRTLGAFAALDAADVASRFSADAITAHRMARGLPGRRPSRALIPAELHVEHRCDPPVDRIDAAAFLGRRMAQELHERLASAALACTRLTVHAITESGQEYARTWRCAEPLTPDATADRVRWQLEGWLTGRGGRGHRDEAPDAPIVRLILEPVEVIDPGALHDTLPDTGPAGMLGPGAGQSGLDDGARRALVRVQGLLGGDAVQVPVHSGGRGPADQVALVAFGDVPKPPRDPAAAWPGRLARPAPTLLTRIDAEVIAADGTLVTVTPRGAFNAEPALVRVGSRVHEVRWWAGPWPIDPETARAQVLLDDSRALLLSCRNAAWAVEGVYE